MFGLLVLVLVATVAINILFFWISYDLITTSLRIAPGGPTFKTVRKMATTTTAAVTATATAPAAIVHKPVSGKTTAVIHPLVLLSVSDHYTRACKV